AEDSIRDRNVTGVQTCALPILIIAFDVTLANASNAIIIGFNVRPDANARRTAENEKVDIRLHRVIYKALEEIEQAMKGMLDPERSEERRVGKGHELRGSRGDEE